MRAIALAMMVLVAGFTAEGGSREAFLLADANYAQLLQQAKNNPTFENRRLACEGWYDWYLALEAFEDTGADGSLYGHYATLSDEHSAACVVETLADGTPAYVPRG